MKNKELTASNKTKMCETHNDKNVTQRKTKLCVLKSHACIKTYHPLKNKRVKLHRLKFVCNQDIDVSLQKRRGGNEIFSKRFKVLSGKPELTWSTESEVVEWLNSVNIPVKRLPSGCYIIDEKMLNINAMLLFANKKRAERGLPAFYIEGITEY